MIRIGIIGTENSHAIAFSKIINLSLSGAGERLYKDLKVVGVYGPDQASAKEVAKICGADFIADSPEDFFGRVDAMMITSRKGSVHAGYAMPFIERGIPLFIDKPITSDPEEARDLLERAETLQVKVLGGSGCKMIDDIKAVSAAAEASIKANTFSAAVMSYSADLDSVYDGFYFYASHLVEMALCVFGYEVRCVRAVKNGSNVTALLRYDGYDITLLFAAEFNTPCCLLSTKEGYHYQAIALSHLYEREVECFAEMLRTGKMPFTYEQLVKPIYVIDAIIKSLHTDAEINVCSKKRRR